MSDTQWQPLLAAILVSLLCGVAPIAILIAGTRKPMKKHLMNVFNQIFFALFFAGALVRCFYWIMFAWPGEASDSDHTLQSGLPIGIRAFLVTYPQLNILVCSFLIQYPWLYDFMLLQNGIHINLFLRQQMKMFVVAAVIFAILLYLVYLFAFPIDSDESSGNSKLFDLYNTLIVFGVISALLIVI
jgi:multisubunit Na+/H+ antiporter MnhB subunit